MLVRARLSFPSSFSPYLYHFMATLAAHPSTHPPKLLLSGETVQKPRSVHSVEDVFDADFFEPNRFSFDIISKLCNVIKMAERLGREAEKYRVALDKSGVSI